MAANLDQMTTTNLKTTHNIYDIYRKFTQEKIKILFISLLQQFGHKQCMSDLDQVFKKKLTFLQFELTGYTAKGVKDTPQYT